MICARIFLPIVASIAMVIAVSMPLHAAVPSSDAEPGPLRGHKFAQIAIQVTDVDRATAFYRDVLGLQLLFVANGMVFFAVGDARLMIVHGKPGTSTIVYFDDPNLEQSRVRLEASGVKFSGPIETVQRTTLFELKLLEFPDPDGNPLALMGQVKLKEK